MRLAAIDIGTNTVRLKVCDIKRDKLDVITRGMEITRLGFNVEQTGRLDDDAIDRTVRAVSVFKRTMDETSVERVAVLATSAVRDAGNGEGFVKLIRKKTGLSVEIIEGLEEARLSYLGATRHAAFLDNRRDIVVMDIGGGSTELILGRGDAYEFARSIDIGSVRLTEMFIRHDPPLNGEIDRIKACIRERAGNTLASIHERSGNPLIVGVAGTVTTMVAVRESMDVYDPDAVHMSVITLSEMADILGTFRRLKLEERRLLPGLEPARADVIIAGTVIAMEIAEALGADELVVSENDILDGAIWALADGTLGFS